MKVIVRCASNKVTKADMEREIERLFQENKDLRVSEGHLRDDLTCAQARIEKLNAELAESSRGMSTMVKLWEEAVNEKIKAEERAEEYRIALMESDCRVDECEKRIEYLEDELKQTEAIANQVIKERDELLERAQNLGKEIDRLRKVVVDLQTHRFTVSEIKNMICQYLEGFDPSADSLNF